MHTRERFHRKLTELRADILKMGSQVEAELALAMRAFDERSADLSRQVYQADEAINQARFQIEERCLTLIVTQQPMAGDLRMIVAAINMIVDLERMGDQAKGIAKVVPHLANHPDQQSPAELARMAQLVSSMLHRAMMAYANEDATLARTVASEDDDVDRLYAGVFNQIMYRLAQVREPEKAEAIYELLRAARELERFGDLATNVAERVIFLVTGHMDEVNVDRDDSAQ